MDTIDLGGYRHVLFDLDGTVAIGASITPGAAEFVSACRDAGASIGFITNASMFTTAEISQRLAVLSVGAPGDLLMTASLALAGEVGRAFRTVVCAGHAGLHDALLSEGLEVIPAQDGNAVDLAEQSESVAVVLGLFPDQLPRYEQTLVDLLRAGAPCYVPTDEPNWPTPDGLQPGNGETIELLQRRVAVEPIVCGKPSRIFARQLVERGRLHDPVLVVGDSWHADLALAIDNAWDSLLVLTGTTSAADLSGPASGATHVAADLVEALAMVR